MDSVVGKAVLGARLASRQLDALANDLANVSTAGFKQSEFATMLVDAFGVEADSPEFRAGAVEPHRALIATGLVNLEQGSPVGTGRDFDLAIDGEGFFTVQTPAGLRYTRNGAFQITDQGVLSTADGLPVIGESGPISVPQGKFVASEEGRLFVDGAEIGKLRLVTFPDPDRLTKQGASLFEYASDEPPVEAENTKVLGGHIEQSNVDMVGGMIQMMSIQRAYEAYRKLIDTNTAMNEQGVSVLGKVTA